MVSDILLGRTISGEVSAFMACYVISVILKRTVLEGDRRNIVRVHQMGSSRILVDSLRTVGANRFGRTTIILDAVMVVFNRGVSGNIGVLTGTDNVLKRTLGV